MKNPFENTQPMIRETRNKPRAMMRCFVSRFGFCAVAAAALMGYLSSGALAQTTLPLPPPPNTGPATQPKPDPVQPSSTLQEAFHDVSLERAVANLRSLTGANFVVNWKALEDAGVMKQSRVQVSLTRPVKLRKLISLILESASPQVPLAYEVEDNVVHITTQAEADKHMVTRLYSVDELLITPVPVAKAKFDLQSGGSGSGVGNFQTDQQASSPTEEKSARAASADEFIRLVTTNIRPEIWKQNGGAASIAIYQGKLVVTAPLSVQEQLRP